MEISIIII